MKNLVLTISGKTCSGKTYLLDQLLKTEKFSKLVTSTTRHPRAGENDSLDYHFIQSSLAEHYIDTNRFIEYNVYGNQIYGLTEFELKDKLKEGKIPCAILTPNGALAYKNILTSKFGVEVLSIFIDCHQDLLISRLAKRVLEEPEITFDVLKVSLERAISVSLNEQSWKDYLNWDLVLSAENPNLDAEIINFVKQFSNS